MKNHTVVLITGGTCSGKSEFAKWFRNSLIISLDDFYIGKSQMTPRSDGSYNFDSPEAIDITACAYAITSLLENKKTIIPKYDMFSSERVGEQELILSKNTKFVIVEGIYAFYSPLREIADIKIYIDTPVEIRVARRLVRDINRTGHSKIQTLKNMIPIEENYQKYIEPTKEFADVVIPFSSDLIKITTPEG